MSYIRTKDGIYEVIKNDFGVCIKIDCMFILLDDIKDKIIKQADNLAELCDYFSIDKNDIEHYEPTTLLIFDDYDDFRYSMFGYENASGYGCIKTDKGLIYVAKMVDGKLVLI